MLRGCPVKCYTHLSTCNTFTGILLNSFRNCLTVQVDVSKNAEYCVQTTEYTLPYLTFGVGRLLHLPSAEAVSVWPNAQPRCNQRVTVIGCEAEKSPATWDW